MTSLTNYKEEALIKMLLIGESGSGKTGALAALAKAGYDLRILDFDSGLDILAEVLKNDKEALSHIEFENCTDKLQVVGTKIIPQGVPTGFKKALNLMTSWTKLNGASSDLGKPSKWGSNTFLVIDSATHMGNAAIRLVQALNNRSGEKLWQDEWGSAQQYIENVLALLYSEAFKCNVIVIAHVTYMGGEKGEDGEPDNPEPLRGLPTAPGKKLSPRIPSYFNTMLLAKAEGTGTTTKRYIYTVPDGVIGVKQPMVNADIPKKLPIETGLATFVNKFKGKE